ncbi:MAG: hypothetical protein IPH34_07485 [Chitinophagaceae bacterium]|nr:hypothetical protein [Chitinophagaceae bacterium]
MLDQLFNLVKQFGQDTVIENPEIPNEQNEEVIADATKTIGSGFQNMMAGGGFESILDLFKGGGNSGNGSSGGGIAGLLKNPIVTMMIGYFTNKLVSKYKMAPSSASNVSASLIPNVSNKLITNTTSNASENDAFDFNDLISSLTGGNVATKESQSNGFDFQGLLNQFTGAGSGGNGGGGFNIGDIISQVTQGAQKNQGEQANSGGGLMDLIKGFMK